MNPDFRDMLSALCEEKVEFLLVGAYALAFPKGLLAHFGPLAMMPLLRAGSDWGLAPQQSRTSFLNLV